MCAVNYQLYRYNSVPSSALSTSSDLTNPENFMDYINHMLHFHTFSTFTTTHLPSKPYTEFPKTKA